MDNVEVVVIGAGPHGLAAAAKLRRAGIEHHVLGDPMSFWRTMPHGMLLRSNWTATSIAEYDGPLSLESYRDRSGRDLRLPLPLQDFLDYGGWVQQQVVPEPDTRRVVQVGRTSDDFLLRLGDGDILSARRVVVAAGIADFVRMPEVARDLPGHLVSHTSQHRDLSRFRDRAVVVVGLGQSALESAALMHEAGASVEVIGRKQQITWLHGGKYHRKLGRFVPLFYAPTDVGPLGLSRVVAAPDLFRRLPRTVQDPLAYRSIRPAAAAWLGPRLAEVPVTTGRRVTRLTAREETVVVELDDGSRREVDHVVFGTGYQVDVARYPFLQPDLVARVRRRQGYPLLTGGMESSVPGLHFLGAPASWSFGPTMRFVAGGWFGSERLVRGISGERGASPAPAAPAPSR
ncbi:MAG TPA: NAD(P)-binding domain-containing protein [Pedococcus sp.]|nr:NAD(P)-binding domain-containing protein [Pedococcus sp.]